MFGAKRPRQRSTGPSAPDPPLAVITCRSASSKFIPSAPPSRHLKESRIERERHQERAARLKRRLAEAGLPVMPSPSHIVSVMVGDPGLCKALGIKGLGEIGTVGVAAAIANAIYHAIGKRVRDLPITLDKLQR
jgi:hypothetical protein